jgi:hypothetical protein
VTQVVEHLLCKCKTRLSSNSSSTPKNVRKNVFQGFPICSSKIKSQG